MAINQLIAQGIAPIGRDVPDIINMQQRNALAQHGMDIQQQNALQYQRSLDMQSKSREQDIAAQRVAEARQWVGANYERLKADPSKLPQLVQLAKQSGVLPAGIPDNAPLEDVAGILGVQSPQAPVPFDQTPDGIKAAEQRRQFDARLGFDQRKFAAEQRAAQQGQGGLGKPPPGYQWNPDGSLAAIKGGPADQRATLAAEKDQQRAANAAESAGALLTEIDDAIGLTTWDTAGMVGNKAREYGYEPAVDLESKLETIKANLGFSELQKMREASPTGGALGQVAVQELVALQSTVASLKQGQSRGQLKKNLQKIRTHYANWAKVMEQSGGAQSAPEQGGDAGPVDYEFVPGRGLVRAGR